MYILAPKKTSREPEWLAAAQVFRSVQGIAQQLNTAGVTAGSCVALRMERNTEAVLILLALRLIGAIAVLTEPHTEPEMCLAACTDSVRVDAVITHCEESWLLRRGGKIVLRLCLDAECSKERPVPLNEDAQAPGYVIFTSGSTGKAKAVVLSDYNLNRIFLNLGCSNYVHSIHFLQESYDVEAESLGKSSSLFCHFSALPRVVNSVRMNL